VVFTAGFAYWIPRFWRASVIYGSLAAIVIVILWLKILMMILLAGAALNEALLEEKQMQEACGGLEGNV
jgi:membrane protein